MPHHPQITGIGSYAPENVIFNDYFDKYYKKDMDNFLRQRRNIHQRHFMLPEQRTSDLIVPAAQRAMEMAQIEANQLDLILVATDTPDYTSPPTACVVQHKLKAGHCPAFDVNAACAGFVTALDMAHKYMLGDPNLNTVLLTAAYGISRHLNWEDYKITSLFGDGAGAVVLQRRESHRPSFLSSKLTCQGQYHDALGIYEKEGAPRDLLKFTDRFRAEFNGENWPPLIKNMLGEVGKQPEDVARYFFTQINIESIHQTLDHLGLEHSKAHYIMDRYGYTGGACIVMGLADAYQQGALKKGDLVALIASGAGVAMAGMAMEWTL